MILGPIKKHTHMETFPKDMTPTVHPLKPEESILNVYTHYIAQGF